jgi:hypothetical protein
MTIDATIDNYRATKDAMESIIDRHMIAALNEIRQEFGVTPTAVSINILESQPLGQKYPDGVYDRCDVSIGGE